MSKNAKKLLVIAVSLFVLAAVFYWTKTQQPAPDRLSRQTAITPQTRYLSTLESLDTFVVRHTAIFTSPDETSDGTPFTITETVRHEYSLSPNLRVETSLPASVSASLSSNPQVQSRVAQISQAYTDQENFPLYIVTDPQAQTITYYENFGGDWTYSTKPLYQVDRQHFYGGLWETNQTPKLISDSVLQARDSADTGTYNFYFNDQDQLTMVEFIEDGDMMSEEYQILDELPIVTIPATVMESAVEFQPEIIFEDTSEYFPTVGESVYVPDME